MPSFSIIAASAAGGKGVIPSTPTISHGASAGTFTITNYDSRLRYVVTSGSVSGSTINLGTGGTVQSQIVAYSPKGVSSSPSKTMERRTITYSYVQVGTAPGSCSYLPHCGSCGNCPSCAQCTPSGGLCIFCSGGGPIFDWVKNGTPSGFTESYGEWWKII